MLGALIIVAVLLGIAVWVTWRVTRVPKKPEHERTKTDRDLVAEAARMMPPNSGGPGV